MNRFDSIQFTEENKKSSDQLIAKLKELEDLLHKSAGDGRSKSLALTALEEAAMWMNKAIRDHQNGGIS